MSKDFYGFDDPDFNRGHTWKPIPLKEDGMQYCETCGIVRRADDNNKPCKGPTRLRQLEKPLPTELPQ